MHSTTFKPFKPDGILRLALFALTISGAALVAVAIQTEQVDAQAPLVSAGGPYQALAGEPIQFTGTSMVGSVVDATWSFSDGSSMSGLSVVKAFTSPGSFSATLTVTDAAGRHFSVTAGVTVLAQSSVGSAFNRLDEAFVPLGAVFLVNGQLVSNDSPLLAESLALGGERFVALQPPTAATISTSSAASTAVVDASGRSIQTPTSAQAGATPTIVPSNTSPVVIASDGTTRLAGPIAVAPSAATATVGNVALQTCSNTSDPLFAITCLRP